MRQRTSTAFTLIELILVLVVMASMLAMAAPSLRNWSQGSKLKNAAEQIIAAAGYARSQAITTANVYRLEIDGSAATYKVKHEENGIPVTTPGEFGENTPLPTGFRLDLKTGGATGSMIEFYPNGRITIATIRVTSPNGDWIEVGNESQAERFRILAQK